MATIAPPKLDLSMIAEHDGVVTIFDIPVNATNVAVTGLPAPLEGLDYIQPVYFEALGHKINYIVSLWHDRGEVVIVSNDGSHSPYQSVGFVVQAGLEDILRTILPDIAV